jgi:hypothetical protein
LPPKVHERTIMATRVLSGTLLTRPADYFSETGRGSPEIDACAEDMADAPRANLKGSLRAPA